MLQLESGDTEFFFFTEIQMDLLLSLMPLIVFITAENFHILSETLDSSVGISDIRININGYPPLRGNYPSITKCGGVYIYYKDYLAVIRRTDSSNLRECLVTKVTIGKKNTF